MKKCPFCSEKIRFWQTNGWGPCSPSSIPSHIKMENPAKYHWGCYKKVFALTGWTCEIVIKGTKRRISIR